MAEGLTRETLAILRELERKVLWLSTFTIHNANLLREKPDGLKVGGHQASSASFASIMTALYFRVLRPEDRVAVKPHASPVFHAIQYFLGNQTATSSRISRAWRRAILSFAHQGHRRCRLLDRLGRPRRRADRLFSLVQDYFRSKDWADVHPGRAAWSRSSAMPSWTRAISTRRFSKARSTASATLGGSSTITGRALTASSARGSLTDSASIFESAGWEVVILKYGTLLEAAFAEAGGDGCGDGSTIVRTRSIRRSRSREARHGVSASASISAGQRGADLVGRRDDAALGA